MSQIDSNGKIVVLLKSLKENTEVTFSKIIATKKRDVLQAVMSVKEDTEICASWINLQEVTITIDPEPVSTITLVGKPVYTSERITVLTP